MGLFRVKAAVGFRRSLRLRYTVSISIFFVVEKHSKVETAVSAAVGTMSECLVVSV